MEPAPRGIDASVPSGARIYDFLLGGKDHFAADRQAARRLLGLVPEAALLARHNRDFLRRAVRYCAARGVGQFVDIGPGMPARDNTHEVAREILPGARVAYVDHDPIVVSHGRALLARAGGVVAVEADVRKPGEVLGNRELRELIDFGEPVAVLFVSVLHFVPEAAEVVAAFRDALAPGGLVVLSHGVRGPRTTPADAAAVKALFAGTAHPVVERSPHAVGALLDGLDPVEPGLVPVWEWHPDDDPAADIPGGSAAMLGAVARKP
ncbi:SAM-dependent methyltransferase [Thermocatellispora tengchongensis]|uniref:SAM-dependent methyltransferase n=1 Tax=Thermocatellispora tengchongensis TaxID=1073253 RepID=A0A840P5C1_9ACTN|nr:SAM-dependent methyltransferase [Thermocatellispora tengchongensis]MBB5133103.1 SAM-dependent methyltransferase [Thermocatellispora tengchongensis]